MYSKRDTFLKELLKCGYQDLEMLDDIGCNIGDVIDRLEDSPIQEVGLSGLMRAVVDVGIINLKQAIDDRICELEAIPNERELDADEEEELRVLRRLDPDNDVHGYYNGVDTSVWFEKNGPDYCKYVPDEVDAFELDTGLRISRMG